MDKIPLDCSTIDNLIEGLVSFLLIDGLYLLSKDYMRQMKYPGGVNCKDFFLILYYLPFPIAHLLVGTICY